MAAYHQEVKRGGWVLIGVAAMMAVAFGLVAVFVAPHFEGVRSVPLLQFVAMRRLVGAVLLTVSLLLLGLMAVRRRGWLRILAVGLAIASLVGLSVILSGVFRDAGHGLNVDIPGGDVVFLSWNTNQENVDSSTIISTIEKIEPDVVVLPEYFDAVARAQLGEWADENAFTIYSAEASASSVLISEALGEYHVDAEGVPAWAGFVAVPAKSSSPEIVVVHAEHAGWTDSAVWNSHLNWVADACDGPNVVAIGDFNAPAESLEDDSLGSCRDAPGDGAGTWPTGIPAGLGVQIDRVLTGQRWSVEQFIVLNALDRSGTDHRPIVAVVREGELN